MTHSDIDLASDTSSVRPRTAFTDDGDDSDNDLNGGNGETDDEDDNWSGDEGDLFDPVTERNTEHNSIVAPVAPQDLDADADPLGEGVNVVVPPDPYFPSTLNAGPSSARNKGRNPRRRKSTRHHEPLALATSRPIFQRDRCTITITQGDPDARGGKRKRYIVASDLSEESRYAVEWGIGTVIRDGDEMMIVNIMENEAKGGRTLWLFFSQIHILLQWTRRSRTPQTERASCGASRRCVPAPHFPFFRFFFFCASADTYLPFSAKLLHTFSVARPPDSSSAPNSM
jgi:hypothetical protein